MSFALFTKPWVLAPSHDLINWSAPETRASTHRLLRVVRIVEAGQAPDNGERMVIAGRMFDVCAELDRLAARESSPH